MPRLVWLLLVFVLVPACAAPPRPAPHSYVLAVLRTGPRADPLPADEQRTVFAGHFENMERLATEGKLLLAGPFGSDRSDPARRGLFVLATADRATAERWAGTDPGVQAGVFESAFYSLQVLFDVRSVHAADLMRRETAQREGRTPKPGDGARGYALLTVDDAKKAAVLVGAPFVVAEARLDGAAALIWIDAPNAQAARELLQPFLAKLGAHQVEDWFGTDRLAALSPTRR
jgi:uncharacterized protein YciI